MKACFIGHRNIDKTERLCLLLKQTIEMLIKKGVNVFLFGSKSAFDNLSWEIVSELKKKYPFIKRVYARSSYQRIDKAYEDYILQFYEQTYFSPTLENAGKSCYIKRNYQMIDNCTYCVFYYDKNYKAIKNGTKGSLKLQESRKSGTKIAYEYALKKKKVIFNMCINNKNQIQKG